MAIAAAPRLALSPPLAQETADAAGYLAVGVTGLLGGFVPGACAALGTVLATHILSAPIVVASKASSALFLGNSALLLALEEAYHRLRPRVSAAPQSRAPASEQLASVALATPGVVGTFYVDPNGRVAYRYVSPKARTVFGLDPEDICADAGVFFKRLGREHLDALNEGLFRSARDLSMWVVEFPFDHPEKGPIWMEAQAAPVREDSGLVVWHGYASDVTARKRVELSLEETAARLQATIDAAQDAVLTMDADGRIQTVNRSGVLMFGRSADEIAGRRVEELLGADKEARNGDGRAGERREFQGRRRSGELFPAEMTISETLFENRSLRVAFIKDLTERRKIELQIEELHRSRLDAMGGMAAALAHEINQPLAANATYLRVAQRLLEKSGVADEALFDILEKATAQTLRAGRIVTSLKNLVCGGEPDKTLLGVHEVIHEAAAGAGGDCERAGVRIELKCEAASDRVVADRSQLRQAIANLIRNATEAMQSAQRRELIIATTNPGDDTIVVDVIDSGCGLPESSDAGCFEPFRTTKPKGLGVGLSISRSIIEAHYGRIWATPNAEGGAVFSFSLPLLASDVDA
ncbi:PAS domain-containing sensor histidine kinase [Methylocystis parvus]|uniref:PAS domain-containing sensor histidine kinase n=1 Tax=Methylocystis parvus TaxID=134 RepID=UPI003C738628